MKALFIGGTGNISTACSKLALEKGVELYVLNRGKRSSVLEGAKSIVCDIKDKETAKEILKDYKFDVVVNYISFNVEDVERDFELFRDKTDQYIFISSASVYQKPLAYPIVTESTPLCNPFWDYSRNKIACEELLLKKYREHGFPVTIVRPSLTYDTVIPAAIGSWTDYTLIDRIRKGEKIVVHGDGSSLWTVTHSADFAKGLVGLLGHQQAVGNSFHITSDEILTWDQIYEVIANAVGAKANIVHASSDFICSVADSIGQGWMRGNLMGDKAVSAIFDNSKIKSFVPDFKATIPFKQGIERTMKWFESDPSRMVISESNNILLDKIIMAYENALTQFNNQ